MSQHGSMTPEEPAYTGKTIPPIADLHDSNGDGFWGSGIKVTDEAVHAFRSRAGLPEAEGGSEQVRWVRAALEAAVPHLQVQGVDRQTLALLLADTVQTLDKDEEWFIADRVLALLSPEETK